MMDRNSGRSRVVTACGVLAALLCSSLNSAVFSAARRATPPDSYLQYKVYTVDQLVQQVQANPRIRAVYARTFHIPEGRVVDYMRHNVVESYIPYTKTYTVYCVTSSGRVFKIHQVFRQGTKVFALRNGQPVFKWVCGNPLMAQLPTVKTKTKTVQTPAKVVTKVSPSAETLIPTQSAVELIPSEEVALLPTAPVITTAASGVTSVTGPGGFPLWLPLLPLGFIHSNGSGGSSSSTNTTGSATTTVGTTTVGPTTNGPTTITNTTTIGPTATSTSTTGPTTNTTTTGPTTNTTTTGPTTSSTTTTGPTATSNTTTTGPTTTNSTTTGPTATISTTGPTTETSSTTFGPTSTETTTIGEITTGTNGTTGTTTVPEPSSSTSIAVGMIPLILAILLNYRSSRRKRKVDLSTK